MPELPTLNDVILWSIATGVCALSFDFMGTRGADMRYPVSRGFILLGVHCVVLVPMWGGFFLGVVPWYPYWAHGPGLVFLISALATVLISHRVRRFIQRKPNRP